MATAARIGGGAHREPSPETGVHTHRITAQGVDSATGLTSELQSMFGSFDVPLPIAVNMNMPDQ